MEKYSQMMKYYGITNNDFFSLPTCYQDLLIAKYYYLIKKKKITKNVEITKNLNYNINELIERERVKHQEIKKILKK